MFDYPGSKLKSFAKFFLVAGIIACVAFAFIFGIKKVSVFDGYEAEERTKFFAGPFFGWLIGGPLGCYLVSLGTYAFGEIVENSEQTSNELR